MDAAQESGDMSLKPWAKYDQNSSSWKTFLRSGRGVSKGSPKTWPRSGMSCGGTAYERQTSEPPTTEIVGSESPYLKTPTANLGKNGGAQHPLKRKKSDLSSGGGGGGSSSQPHGPTLADEVCFLLPYADSSRREGGPGALEEPGRRDESADPSRSPAEWWGDYLPVIRRWEEITGKAAPPPTEYGPRGGKRLAAAFAEWMMGYPGYVTEVPGIKRSEALQKIGNGVVPHQAYAAYKKLLKDMQAGRS